MNGTSRDDYRWLLGNDAGRVLRDLVANAAEDVKQVARLRRRHSAARVHLLLKQARLRRHARGKFPHAERLFFTQKGLEQSTDWYVAQYKAARFQGRGEVADLCCGIGGDLLGLSNIATCMAVDRCPIAAMMARENLAMASRVGDSLVVNGDIEAASMGRFAAWHVDPDRRTGDARTTRAEYFAPDVASIDRLLALNPHGAVKLAPATTAPTDWAAAAELEWISRAGECKQQVAWFGDLARFPGRRKAAMLTRKGEIAATFTADGSNPIAPISGAGRFLFEPDAAVIAAGLVDELAARNNLAKVDAKSAYLVGNSVPPGLPAAVFEIQEQLPFDVRRVKAMLKQRRIGRLEIKKRGVDVAPETLKKQLQVEGDLTATLLLSPTPDGVRAWLATRLEIRKK